MSSPSPSIPAPGQAELVAPNAAALLRRNATDPTIASTVAIRFEDRSWTHGEYLQASIRWANLFTSLAVPGQPLHIAVLLDNIPEYLFAFGGAALSGATIVGVNHTRQGEHLLRDLVHTDCVALVTEPKHRPSIDAIRDGLPFADERVLVVGESLDAALAGVSDIDAGLEPDVMTPWALIFTSGTSDAPKAVICSQKRLMQTGNRMAIILGLGPDDMGYVCMPLFHSNAVMVGWMPSLIVGCGIALVRKFSASGWLPDIRRFGSTYFNYTGKPLAYLLATPEQPDDADNTMRVAFGNEGAPEVVERFSTRFGVEVIDAFGSTEGGIAVNRDAAERHGAMGQAPAHILIVDEDGHELPPARFDAEGRLINADECVGEIVNTQGAGPFEGYYNNAGATEKTMRNGWYWSGDLGYFDDDRYLYFAGRNADWIRVDGENFPAQPIEIAVGRHPDVVIAAVYGVPDVEAGDQAMAAVMLKDGCTFDGAAFAAWFDGLDDIGPKWRPRYVRIAPELPTTGTNKVVKRTLVHQKFRRDRVGTDELFVRERGEDAYRPFTDADERALHDTFEANGRGRFWDL